MPRYDYRCDHCNKEVEETRTIADMETLKPCLDETCGGTLRKMFTLGRVIGVKNVPNN